MRNGSAGARAGVVVLSLSPALLGSALALVAGTASAFAAGDSVNGVVLGVEARSNRLSLAGAEFHRTDQPVVDLRTIAVPGTSEVLILWNQVQPDGSKTAFYAVSLDGRSIAGRVRETTYIVRLRDAAFDPLVQAEPWVPQALRAGPGNEVFMVQFWVPPMQSFRDAITAAGGTVERFLSDHTYAVRMGPEARRAISALPYVRWVGAVHPAYRTTEDGRRYARGANLDNPGQQRWSIECFRQGPEQQQAVAGAIKALGGVVHYIQPDLFRMEATMSPEAFRQVLHMNEVCFSDPWLGPGGHDMDIGRQLMGDNVVQGLPPTRFNGEGMRGEIFDTGWCPTHTEWAHPQLQHSPGVSTDSHGTSTMGICFARGASPQHMGHLPRGQGIFYRYNDATSFGGSESRLLIAQESVDPSGPFRSLFQTSSVGNPQVTTYGTLSAEMDTVIFQTGYLHCQSQSNTGDQRSRPEAWAKNMVSGGAVQHNNSANRGSHVVSGASTGPATDGRVKPTLAGFYDNIATVSACSYTSGFGGTSGGTPMVCGTFGVFFHMWHEGVWDGFGGGPNIFDDRAKFTTAKAAMISTAFRYPFTQFNRFQQAWGMPDLAKLHSLREKTFIVDEADVLPHLGSVSYDIDVLNNEPELLISMVYMDPQATNFGGRHRINDLSLKVTAPNGTVYWGNNGLLAGNYNTPGGTSNLIDVEENVFVQNPAGGTWTVEVFGDEIVQDQHLETPGVDADFGLWVVGGTGRTGLGIRLVNGAPTELDPGAPTDIDVLILPGGDTLVPGTAKVHYRFAPNDPFAEAPMTHTGGDNYIATIPGASCTQNPEFYFSARGVSSGLRTNPSGAPTNNYDAIVGAHESGFLINADFAAGLPAGWTRDGLWAVNSNCAPSGTCGSGSWLYYGVPAQCNYNNGARNQGVAASPVVNIPELPWEGSVTLKYCSAKVSEAACPFDCAEVYFNGVRIDRPPESQGWVERTIDMSAFAGQSGRLEFRFDTGDGSRNNFRGWHVDNVRLSFERRVCEGGCYPDCDTSTGVGVLDVFDFLCFQNAYDNNEPYACDCDLSTGPGTCDVFDFLCFQNAYDAGCP